MEYHWRSYLTNQFQVYFPFCFKAQKSLSKHEIVCFQNSKIAIMIPTALNSELKFENLLVLHRYRPVLTILGVVNYFQI